MPRTWLLFFALLLILLPPLPAQEDPYYENDPEDTPIDDWYDYDSSLYTAGDRTFVITLGLVFPSYFGGEIDNNNHGIGLGGTGSLAFNYFLTSNVFLGGELGGMFASTRGRNMLYIIPFGVRIGYQFIIQRLEFPLSLLIGAAPQRKNVGEDYFGLFIKPGASVFYRFSADWSFGLNANWWFVPQWPKDGHNVYGNFMELTLSARYHF